MKRILLHLLFYILFVVFILSTMYYIYNKTIWKDKTDCMIQYINNYYPYWSIYKIDWYSHIDKRWLNYLWNEHIVNWCYIDDSLLSFIFNTSYCYLTLFYEKYLLKYFIS